MDFDWLKRTLTTPVIVDGRNLFDPMSVKAAGLRYFAMGRGESLNTAARP